MNEGIRLGAKYRDSITGYEGTATGRAEYLTGCDSVKIERADNGGKPENVWIDAPRLEPV